MASIYPFRALRPTPATVARVAAVPYDVVSTAEARALAAGNPLSFLHVSRSEIDLPADTHPYDDKVYEQARRAFAALASAAPLVTEAEPSLYFYRLRMGDHEQTGLTACFSVDEYDRDLIKKHERTRRDKEDDRTRHVVDLAAQTGVVFLTYAAAAEIDALAARACSLPALFDFTAADGVRHTVWRVGAGEVPALQSAFANVPALYIADGHHRAASAARARAQLRQAAGNPATTLECDTFLAVAFPHDQMQILPYHRVVKDLAGRSPEAFLAALSAVVPVASGVPTPAAKGTASMYLGGKWYALDLRPRRPADELDVATLQERVLAPLLGIVDVRTDKRIDFVGGSRGTAELARVVDAGEAAVAFSLHPVTIADLMAIADAGGIMPPKSTWFEPKLRDGLLIHCIGPPP
jgi:uncharacterized protein (DUF1015 family)